MPKKKDDISAEELMRQLESDPEWVAKRDAKDARRAEWAIQVKRDQAPILDELNAVGVHVTSVYDFISNDIAPVEAFPILLRHLDLEYLPVVRQGLIRALGVPTAKGIAFQRLCDLFVAEKDDSFRWLFANALSGMARFSEVNHLNGMERFAGLFQ